MRTYGRVTDEFGVKTWVEVQTDANGFNDFVYATALVQELKLNLGESPFWGDRGIPAHPSVIQQIAPDYYTNLIQQRYASKFASLIISRFTDTTPRGAPIPSYRVQITTMQGATFATEFPT